MRIKLIVKEEKRCSGCGKEKSLIEFSKNKFQRDGYCNWCKECMNEYYKEYSQTEKFKKIRKRYYQSEKYKKYKKRNNKQYSQTLQGRIINNLRSRIRQALKGTNKSAFTIKLLGCSIEEFLSHLESQFQVGMTFENYGEWHIDHIIPCSEFDLTKLKEQRKCFHYSNLQPLWWEDNLKKSNKIA